MVAKAIGAFGRSGCAGRVAQEFGDHPETAVIRMRWARGVAREAFADPAPEPGQGAGARGWPVIGPRLPAEQASGGPGGGIVSSRRRLPAYLSAGDGDAAALEMERHLRTLRYMGGLARAAVSEAVT